jgi:hypothetical protein
MNVYAIYDETGSIYAVRYGDNQHIPNELRGLYQEVPDGALIDGVDVSDTESHKLLFTPPKESVLEKELVELKESNDKLSAQIAYLSMMSGFDVEEV